MLVYLIVGAGKDSLVQSFASWCIVQPEVSSVR